MFIQNSTSFVDGNLSKRSREKEFAQLYEDEVYQIEELYSGLES